MDGKILSKAYEIAHDMERAQQEVGELQVGTNAMHLVYLVHHELRRTRKTA